jgi:ribosomal-protein-alanine N-acetyltransferase
MPSFASASLRWIAPLPGFRSVFEFETPRLRVRPLAPDDAALYCDLYTDAQTMRFIEPPLSVERATRLLLRYLRLPPAADKPLLFAILEKRTGHGLGICSIQQLDERNRRAEVGIMLKPAFHARGFGKEGLAALVRQAFAILPVDEIGVRVAAHHSVVERLVGSVGFARRTGSGTGGEPHATHFWSVYRDSWTPNGHTATERMPCRT